MRILIIIGILLFTLSSCKEKDCIYTYEFTFVLYLNNSKSNSTVRIESNTERPPIEKARLRILDYNAHIPDLETLELAKEPLLVSTICE